MKLTETFLAPYRYAGDCFPNLLARATYLTKYCRDGETWTDTIRRVVEANTDLDPSVSLEETEKLYHAFWTMQCLPPGRGLWTGGIEGIPVDARYNCWCRQIKEPMAWGWIADRLMLGGGVGESLAKILSMPVVKYGNPGMIIRCAKWHEDYEEVHNTISLFNKQHVPSMKSDVNQTKLLIDDSREGWVDALEQVIAHAYMARPILVDISDIRCRGSIIKTFGGVASGPAPLVKLLLEVWHIVRNAQGRKLNSVECLDVTNHVGFCIKSGNVRRSSLIILGDPYDFAFRNAKKDWELVKSHRHTSNNSIMFTNEQQFLDFDWYGLAEDMATMGEPGIANLALVHKTDPEAVGFNPCGEQALHDGESCNLAEIFPAISDGTISIIDKLKITTRYSLRQRLEPLIDPLAESVGKKNMRIGVGLGGICDFRWNKNILSQWYNIVENEANSYADELGVNRPITKTTVKPSGSISLLNGSSPGNHAAFDKYYIRRMRLADNDPMVEALMDAGVTHEQCVYDNTGHTLVFEFPMQSNAATTIKTDTMENQFKRQVAVQHSWADNAVSQTITFDKDAVVELAGCLEKYVPFLKSTSCLPRQHGYQQAPYESIDKQTYNDMASRVNSKHPLINGGDMELEDCQSGSCPIR